MKRLASLMIVVSTQAAAVDIAFSDHHLHIGDTVITGSESVPDIIRAIGSAEAVRAFKQSNEYSVLDGEGISVARFGEHQEFLVITLSAKEQKPGVHLAQHAFAGKMTIDGKAVPFEEFGAWCKEHATVNESITGGASEDLAHYEYGDGGWSIYSTLVKGFPGSISFQYAEKHEQK